MKVNTETVMAEMMLNPKEKFKFSDKKNGFKLFLVNWHIILVKKGIVHFQCEMESITDILNHVPENCEWKREDFYHAKFDVAFTWYLNGISLEMITVNKSTGEMEYHKQKPQKPFGVFQKKKKGFLPADIIDAVYFVKKAECNEKMMAINNDFNFFQPKISKENSNISHSILDIAVVTCEV